MAYSLPEDRVVRRPANNWPWTAAAVLLVGAALLMQNLVLHLGKTPSPRANPIDHEPAARPITPGGNLAEDERATIELFKQSSRSVVYITTSAVGRDLHFNYAEIPKGTGSGFLWDELGHVVTNFHVVEGANSWRVTLADQSTWNAKPIGVARDKDIAVLRIDAPPEQFVGRLHPIQLGTSRDLEVGQKVFAIGNPFGLDQTLTTGIISGLERQIKSDNGRTIDGVIQTDAAINPGNSGGPLLDSSGRLIGVNTAIYSPSGASVGIGFAIPVDIVQRIVPQIVQFGKVIRPGLGISYAPDGLMRRLGITGVLVANVRRESSAAQAGIRPTRRGSEGEIILGDVIVAVDDRRVKTVDDLLSVLETKEVNHRVRITVLRDVQTDPKEFVIQATLQAVE
jgi:S1-C subfamily serine protease